MVWWKAWCFSDVLLCSRRLGRFVLHLRGVAPAEHPFENWKGSIRVTLLIVCNRLYMLVVYNFLLYSSTIAPRRNIQATKYLESKTGLTFYQQDFRLRASLYYSALICGLMRFSSEQTGYSLSSGSSFGHTAIDSSRNAQHVVFGPAIFVRIHYQCLQALIV